MEQGRLEEFRTVILKKNNLLHDLNELDAIEGEQIVNKMIINEIFLSTLWSFIFECFLSPFLA